MNEARKQLLPWSEDNEKAESARIFYGVYLLARNDEEYQHLKKQHVEKYERKKVDNT
ncbi:hypothetical protein KDW_45140 [Dictyobacter vulcani]|uniref:Uncharacterized protein n=1 Tax=Dictyobacter vulcani TaxID=2607529 RepID=A0A5J4KT67_9CHLR|nr:hypothetical protein KDW_45140 [Dictyobacter vulcani]